MKQKSIFKIGRPLTLLVLLNGYLNAQSESKNENPSFPAPSCFGQPMPNFELPQFSELKDQSSEGTCYSYAAVASVEAALYRQTGQKKALSREYSTVLSCLKQDPRSLNERQKKIGNGIRPLNNFFDGGHEDRSIQFLLDRERAPWDLSPQQEAEVQEAYKKLKQSAGKLSLEAQAQERLLSIEKIEIESQIDSIEKELIKLGTQLDSLTNQDSKREKLTAYNEKKKENDALNTKLNDLNYKIEKNYSHKSRIICDQGHCFLRKITDQSKEVSLRDLEATKDYEETPLKTEGKNKESCNLQNNSHVIKKIMRNLCIGVPVASGTGDTKAGVSDSPDVAPKSKDVSYHAMVINGVKTIDGVPYFTFRNSWGDRGKITILGFWDACKIETTAGVLNRVPLNGEKISEAQAWVHSDMNKPDNEKEKEAYEFFKSRLGIFIDFTDEKPLTEESEGKKHNEGQKTSQKSDLKNSHKSKKK